MAGIFTISLDFELHWGVFDKRDRVARRQCYVNTLTLIPQLLQAFDANDVHVTWATVGSLFAQNESEWKALKPTLEPAYANDAYNPYSFVKKHGLREMEYAHFASEGVAQILNYKGQELGTHTFSHFYCMEQPLQLEAFAADLSAAKHAAQKLSVELISLVFPRNQYNDEYLQVCYQQGIKTVRSNPDKWFWTPVSNDEGGLLRKVFRTGDGYVALGKRTSYPLNAIKKVNGEPLQLPASRLLRSWQPKRDALNKLHISRIKNEMTVAATHNECYHLWWHPENFGDHPQQNFEALNWVLEHYRSLKQKKGMLSLNMGEYVGIFEK